MAQQDEATLVAYISRALQILRNVGLDPNGVTSPWATGRDVEDRYSRAIGTALREVCGVRLGWYFLHVDQQSPRIDPRVMSLDERVGTGLVSILSGSMDAPNAYDFAWRTQFGEPATLDLALSADGAAGRLADLFANGSPITFHTHWQSLFSNGTGTGLAAFEELCGRINRTWGEQIRWTTACELAVAAAARAVTRAVAGEGGRTTLRAPFACPAFTFSMPLPGGAVRLLGDGRPLEHVAAAGGPMREGTWRRESGAARVCVDLHDGLVLTWRGDA